MVSIGLRIILKLTYIPLSSLIEFGRIYLYYVSHVLVSVERLCAQPIQAENILAEFR